MGIIQRLVSLLILLTVLLSSTGSSWEEEYYKRLTLGMFHKDDPNTIVLWVGEPNPESARRYEKRMAQWDAYWKCNGKHRLDEENRCLDCGVWTSVSE